MANRECSTTKVNAHVQRETQSVRNDAMALAVMLDRMQAVSSSAAMPAIMQMHTQPLCGQLQTSPELWERHDAIPTTDRKHACAYTDAMRPETHI